MTGYAGKDIIRSSSGDDEWNKLQEKMTEESPLTKEKSPRPPKGNTPVVDDGSEEVATMEVCQWQAHPNGSFSAAARTCKNLPPGVYNLSQDNEGRIYFLKSKPMTDTLFDLGETVTTEVIDSIEVFWNSKDKFKERGVLFKRGILLWGPAGSGKTATVALLIEKLVKRGGIVIICQNPGMCIAALRVLRRIEPERPLIVIMEDIEEIIEHQGEHNLLSLLDGEHQVNNVVHVATTNYPENLGPRIVNRPSRFDEVRLIQMPNESAREKYFYFTLGNALTSEERHNWAKETNGLSIAHLRELVVATQCLGRDWYQTVKRLKGMAVKPKSSEGVAHPGFNK
jgi:hypothetical protein